MSNEKDYERERIKPIEEIFLRDWISLASAGIITYDEACSWLEQGYIAEWQLKRMFYNKDR